GVAGHTMHGIGESAEQRAGKGIALRVREPDRPHPFADRERDVSAGNRRPRHRWPREHEDKIRSRNQGRELSLCIAPVYILAQANLLPPMALDVRLKLSSPLARH